MQPVHKNQIFVAGGCSVGGRGMNLGIEDACWLAWLMEQKRTSEYSGLHHPVGVKVRKLTARPTNLIASNSFPAKILRRWVVPPILGLAWMQ